MMTVLEWCTLVLAVWAALGPLFGVWVGQKLARKNVRAQWVADSKKREFKELLGSLDTAMEAFLKHVHIPNKTADDFWALNNANTQAIRCVSDRLFILPEVREHQIRERWYKATDELEEGWDIEKFSEVYKKMRIEIITLATEDIK
jgi:hypothetical protein